MYKNIFPTLYYSEKKFENRTCIYKVRFFGNLSTLKYHKREIYRGKELETWKLYDKYLRETKQIPF